MNVLILKNVTDELVVYEFLPEGKGDPGIISYDVKTDEATIVARASNDSCLDRYAHFAIRRIRDYVASGDVLPERGIQAWY